MQYYIDVDKKKKNDAGTKATSDITRICCEMGMLRLSMPIRPDFRSALMKKLWSGTVFNLYWLKNLIVIEKGSKVLYQHPRYYGNKITYKYIHFLQKFKSVKFVAIIHDLETLREGIIGDFKVNTNSADFADNEFLKCFDEIICHNARMINYLIDKGFSDNKLINLEIFDYLYDGHNNTNDIVNCDNQYTVVIAGNLSKNKSGYVYKLTENENIKINLYGPNYDSRKYAENATYFGSVSPDTLPGIITGDFGLVWDGDVLSTCGGNTGNYLRYNNPHKTSLYLVAGIPIIVWEEAAIAEFVKKNNVGITIDNLEKINSVLSKLNFSEYKEMKRNAERIGNLLINGYYFKKAWKK